MGAYLSTPCTKKDSSDEKNDLLNCGASSMQGWRINQEDAHNCELNFDKDASLFAVYDGHGGPEIAQYCSKYFPEYLKTTEAYLRGDFEQALRDAFLGFDAKLLDPEVIEELKVLAGDKYGEDEGDDPNSDSDEDLAELKQEGGMPIEAVLSKYRNMVKNSALERVKDGEPGGSGSGSSSSSSSTAFKPHSPCLRAKKQSITANGDSQKPSGSGEEEAVSSSSAGENNSDASAAAAAPSSSSSSSVDGEVEKKKEEEKEKVAASEPPMESPDSSSAEAKIGNSDAAESSSAAPSSSANDVSSSSGSAAAAVAGGAAAGGSGEASAGGSSSSAAPQNGESSSSSSSAGISSTNVERAAKRVALELSKPTFESSDDSDEDEKDQTYDENNSTDSDEKVEDEDDDDDDEEDEEEDEEEEDYEEMEDDDAFISNMVEEPGKDSGCTAVVAFRQGRTLYVANAGDSRCVLSRSGEVIEMSFDHKPEDEIEHTRINKAGGRVTMDGRVNGGLNLSRAIGDHAYKMNTSLSAAEQMISALPDIKKIELTDKDDFMVLACDGIWNFMSSDSVIQFVKTRMDKGESKLSKICEELFDHCLAKDTSGDGTGCDNMTAIIVRFKWPDSECQGNAEATPVLEVGLKRAASSSPLPEPEIAGSEEADGGVKAKRLKTDANSPTTTST